MIGEEKVCRRYVPCDAPVLGHAAGEAVALPACIAMGENENIIQSLLDLFASSIWSTVVAYMLSPSYGGKVLFLGHVLHHFELFLVVHDLHAGCTKIIYIC